MATSQMTHMSVLQYSSLMIKGKQSFITTWVVFAALAIGCTSYDNIVRTKVIPEI